jgi:hypothetical protein
VKLRTQKKKNKFVKYTNLKKLRRKNKKGEEDIPEHGKGEKELRREEKKKKKKKTYLSMEDKELKREEKKKNKKKKKGDGFVAKLGILCFLLERLPTDN